MAGLKRYLQSGVGKLFFFFKIPSLSAGSDVLLHLSISDNCVLLLMIYTSRNCTLTHRPFIHPPGKSVLRQIIASNIFERPSFRSSSFYPQGHWQKGKPHADLHHYLSEWHSLFSAWSWPFPPHKLRTGSEQVVGLELWTRSCHILSRGSHTENNKLVSAFLTTAGSSAGSSSARSCTALQSCGSQLTTAAANLCL